ncbi:MAG: hypothetical protein ACYDH8_08610 [Syntrophales bacterium]
MVTMNPAPATTHQKGNLFQIPITDFKLHVSFRQACAKIFGKAGVIRIISARPATKKERENYEKNVRI